MSESKSNPARQHLRGRNIVPDTLQVSLPFEDHLTLASETTANLATVNTYRLTSVYDPDYTGAGHQPLGFDQYAALYSKYIVLGARWIVEYYHTGSTVNLVAAAKPSVSASAPSSAETLCELPQGGAALMPQTGGPVTRIRGAYSARRWFGTDPYTNDDIRVAVSDNPFTNVYLHAGIGTITSHTAATVYVRVRIMYDVVFMEPQQLSAS
jgi:hypothetical protein